MNARAKWAPQRCRIIAHDSSRVVDAPARSLSDEKSLFRCHVRAGGAVARQHDDRGRRLRPLRYPGKSDPGAGRERRQGPDDRRQQRRRRRFRDGTVAQVASGEESDRLLRRREQGVRAAGAGRRARASAAAAGDDWRKTQRRRSGARRLLYAHGVTGPSLPKASRRWPSMAGSTSSKR